MSHVGLQHFAQFGVDEGMLRAALERAMSRGGDFAELYFEHRVSTDIGLEDGADDATYLAAVDAALDGSLGRFRADLILYIAGADPFEGDRLGRLAVSRQGLLERDRRVFDAARTEGVPVGIVCGGGYAADVAAVAEIHAATMLLAARDWN